MKTATLLGGNGACATCVNMLHLPDKAPFVPEPAVTQSTGTCGLVLATGEWGHWEARTHGVWGNDSAESGETWGALTRCIGHGIGVFLYKFFLGSLVCLGSWWKSTYS